MCVNNLSNVALDSAAAGIEPATSSGKSNALTTTPPNVAYRPWNHLYYVIHVTDSGRTAYRP